MFDGQRAELSCYISAVVCIAHTQCQCTTQNVSMSSNVFYTRHCCHCHRCWGSAYLCPACGRPCILLGRQLLRRAWHREYCQCRVLARADGWQPAVCRSGNWYRFTHYPSSFVLAEPRVWFVRYSTTLMME